MTILDPSHTYVSLADSVGLDVRLRKAVARLGLVRPTLIQSKCLPLAINSGRDLHVRSSTGSGKTLAYSLPTLQRLLSQKCKGCGPGAIILVPTRELCAQVSQTLRDLTYYCDDVITIAMLSVGQARGDKQRHELDRQAAALRDRPDVVVATPNGLLTHIRSNAIDLKSSVQCVVVDEADLVLSFGYADDMSEIVKSLPRIYQGFLMSATLSPEIDSLKKVVLHSPVIVKLEQAEVASEKGYGRLKQFYLALPKKDKNLVIYVFLKLGLLKGKGLFFVNTTDGGYRLKLFLEQFHIRSAVLNAELPFRSRFNIIEQFNVGNFDYLIATDGSSDVREGKSVAESNSTLSTGGATKKSVNDADYGVSRGLDFQNVSFVVNVDFPPSIHSYTHRVGRTARGGANGVALSLVERESKEQLDTLLMVQEDQPKIPLAGASTDKLHAAPSIAENVAPADQLQPVLLDFDLKEIEGFRYRVEDVSGAVTKSAVRDARAAELKAEILNSERLQSHFEENPSDLQLLQHDRIASRISQVQEHLKHVPKYLLPRGMQVANLNRKRKARRTNKAMCSEKRSDNDPLRSFNAEVNLDGIEGVQKANSPEAGFLGDQEELNPKKKAKVDGGNQIFANTKDGTGRSTAGRNDWKQRHRKGQYSGKKRLSDKKKKEPLGI